MSRLLSPADLRLVSSNNSINATNLVGYVVVDSDIEGVNPTDANQAPEGSTGGELQ